MMTTKSISCRDLAELMASDRLYAVFDVRERGEFNECQIANATSLPRSQIEFRISDLVPNRKIPIVLYDDDGERAILAARTLGELGYLDVSLLDGGLTVFKQAGYGIASGVNVPSKAFGERIHREREIPDILPEELNRLLKQSADVAILDVRTPEEFGRFCIPGGINIPGGDLILWAETLKKQPQSNVIVNCAGRTRSIIGTAALRRLGLTNVRALRNGTMGWLLSGFELENRPQRESRNASTESRKSAHAYALQLMQEERISRINAKGLTLLLKADDGVAYLIDVRSMSEYEGGHIAGSINVPGGQAVQRADDFVAVRNAKIIFISGQATRATMAAYWYCQMGFRDVSVLDGGLDAWTEAGEKLLSESPKSEPLGYASARSRARLISAPELDRMLQDFAPLVLDVGSSLDFETGHIPSARWVSRGWIDLKLPEQFSDRAQSIVLTCMDDDHSVLAARALTEIAYTNVYVLDGGVRAWMTAGYRIETGLAAVLVKPKDIVLSPSIKGDKEAMKQYLEWEEKLAKS
jgi:rhodanese-related sulfurtransferase